MKVFIVSLFLIAIIQYTNAAFQCYKCNNCGTTWDPTKAYLVLTEGGGNYCTKRVSGTTVIKDYSAKCVEGNGMYCCKDELCNSSNSQYHINMALLLLFSITGLIMRYI